MKLPDSMNGSWMESLSDDELRGAEGELHARFARLDRAERARAGETYNLMRGPEELTSAWMRWSMVSNEAKARGLRMQSRR